MIYDRNSVSLAKENFFQVAAPGIPQIARLDGFGMKMQFQFRVKETGVARERAWESFPCNFVNNSKRRLSPQQLGVAVFWFLLAPWSPLALL